MDPMGLMANPLTSYPNDFRVEEIGGKKLVVRVRDSSDFASFFLVGN